MSKLHLHLDFETRSATDIRSSGVERYARDAEAIILGYAINDQEPQICFPNKGPLPEGLRGLLLRPEVVKIAWNVPFEYAIFKHCLGIDIPAEQWLDPAAMARYAGMPNRLADASKFLGLGAHEKKDGTRLIRMFSIPRSTGKLKGTFWQPEDKPAEWQEFIDYCKQDVIAEREIMHRLAKVFSLPERERKLFALDMKINTLGMPTDPIYVAAASEAVEKEKQQLTERMIHMTGLENPNSVQQLLGYLQSKDYPFGSLAAAKVKKAIDDPTISQWVKDVLLLRQQLSKSSTSKLDAIVERVCDDNRIRSNYKYYGAGRTGRWSGEGVQLQNLPRGTVKAYDEAVNAIRNRENLEHFGGPMTTVSSTLRAAFRAPAGKTLVVCDLSAIENRLLGWLAQSDSINSVFERGLDPYIDFATTLYNKAYDQITKLERQMSKPAVLGCGYMLSGGVEELGPEGDVIKTGLWGYAAGMGISMTQEEAHAAVKAWRQKYPEVVSMWYKLEDICVATVHDGVTRQYRGIIFEAIGDKLLTMTLPTGRKLHYIRPWLEEGRFNRPALTYEGLFNGVWGRRQLYGGLITENLVQAIARDVLAEGMLRADAAGMTIVGHTHDEIICEELPGANHLAALVLHMTAPMPWAPDLLLKAEGYENDVYRK